MCTIQNANLEPAPEWFLESKFPFYFSNCESQAYHSCSPLSRLNKSIRVIFSSFLISDRLECPQPLYKFSEMNFSTERSIYSYKNIYQQIKKKTKIMQTEMGVSVNMNGVDSRQYPVWSLRYLQTVHMVLCVKRGACGRWSYCVFRLLLLGKYKAIVLHKEVKL